LISLAQLDLFALLPQKPAVEDAKDYDLSGAHGSQMSLET
jgi:hypothetical protein